jgi:hypothetical protein
MCDPFGSQTRAHHRQQEQMRAESAQRGMIEQAERDRRAQEERMIAFQTAASKQQQEAMAAIAAANRLPVKTGASEAAATPLMRTKQKQTPTSLASLRINRTPGSNIGGMGSSGTNVG